MKVATMRGLASRMLASSTPGERWTASLVILLALALLRFGMPSVVAPFVPSTAAAQPAGPATAAGAPPAPSTSPPSRPGAAPAAPTQVVVRPPSPESPGGPGGTAPVVLLVHPSSGAPGRDDAAMVAAFAARSKTATRTISDSGSADQCAQLLSTSHVFVSSDGVEPPLRDCLLDGGAVVVAFDPIAPPDAPSSRGLLSTRVPLRVSLTDIVRLDRRRLDGRVGVVTTTDLRSEVGAAVDELRGLGVDVRQVAALPTGADATAALPQAVLAFQGAQVDTVVFAAPVDLQNRWAALSNVVRPGTHYVVADAYDAVIDEQYGPVFDGAIAITSIRTPWADRAQPSALQASCTAVWQAAAVPPVVLGPDEQLRAFEWCQHLDLLQQAGTTDPAALVTAVRGLRVESPLTSDLAPLSTDGWGPSGVAELQWHLHCACWQALLPFTERVS